jgi:general secretion pathway protein I
VTAAPAAATARAAPAPGRGPGRAGGFTLIEVLVALAVAAIGLAAVLGVVSNSARNATYLRDKTLAGWIALNHITETRLGTLMPAVERTTGELDYAGQHWKWSQTVTQTDVPGMRRVDVQVRYATDPEDSSLASVTGFVGRTQIATPQSVTSWDGDLIAGAPGGATVLPPPGVAPLPLPLPQPLPQADPDSTPPAPAPSPAPAPAEPQQ